MKQLKDNKQKTWWRRVVRTLSAPDYIKQAKAKRRLTVQAVEKISPLPVYALKERVGYMRSRWGTLWSYLQPMWQALTTDIRDHAHWLLKNGRRLRRPKQTYTVTQAQWRNLKINIITQVILWVVTTAATIFASRSLGTAVTIGFVFMWLGVSAATWFKISLLTRVNLSDE